MTEKLNKVYEVKTGTGVSLGLHLVIAYVDAPTFTLEDVNGKNIGWREDLCKEATQEQEVEYWRARANQGEKRERFRRMSPEEQNELMMREWTHQEPNESSSAMRRDGRGGCPAADVTSPEHSLQRLVRQRFTEVIRQVNREIADDHQSPQQIQDWRTQLVRVASEIISSPDDLPLAESSSNLNLLWMRRQLESPQSLGSELPSARLLRQALELSQLTGESRLHSLDNGCEMPNDLKLSDDSEVAR